MSSTKPEKIEISIENDGIKTMVHEMRVNGYHLVERKQKTMFIPFEDDLHLFEYSWFIDDHSYIVFETHTEDNDEPVRVITTQMTQEEVERFEEDWINLWNPEIDSTFFDGSAFLTANLWIMDHINNNLLLFYFIDFLIKKNNAEI